MTMRRNDFQEIRSVLMSDLPEDLDELTQLYVEIKDVMRELGEVKDQVKERIDRHMRVAGIPVKGKQPRRAFSPDAKKELVRIVLDSRRFDSLTGEAIEETPLAKVMHVFPLGAPRIRALEDRGIDPDEWSQWK